MGRAERVDFGLETLKTNRKKRKTNEQYTQIATKNDNLLQKSQRNWKIY